MQLHALAVFSSLFALSLTQLANLPACAEPCFAQAALNMTVCSSIDTLCICTTGQQQFASLVSPCVEAACNSTDQTKTEAGAVQLCQAAVSSASAAGSTIPTTATASVASISTNTKPSASTTDSKSSSAAIATLAPAGELGSVVGIAIACMIIL